MTPLLQLLFWLKKTVNYEIRIPQYHKTPFVACRLWQCNTTVDGQASIFCVKLRSLLFLAPAVEPKWQDSPPHFVKRYRQHSCIVWYIFPGGRQTSFNKRYKLTSCAVQSTTKLNTAFKPISFPSMFRCHVQTLHQKCVAGCQAKYYLTESHCPNTISGDFQIFSMLLTLLSCAYLPH